MHEPGQISTDGAIRVSVALEHDRKDRVRLDCIRDGSLVTIRLSADAALDLIEDVRGARNQLLCPSNQLLRPDADDTGNVVAQANVIREPDYEARFLIGMAEVFDFVTKQTPGGHGATTTLRQLAAACRVHAKRGACAEEEPTTDSAD
jgi:hypothetical protein